MDVEYDKLKGEEDEEKTKQLDELNKELMRLKK